MCTSSSTGTLSIRPVDAPTGWLIEQTQWQPCVCGIGKRMAEWKTWKVKTNKQTNEQKHKHNHKYEYKSKTLYCLLSSTSSLVYRICRPRLRCFNFDIVSSLARFDSIDLLNSINESLSSRKCPKDLQWLIGWIVVGHKTNTRKQTLPVRQLIQWLAHSAKWRNNIVINYVIIRWGSIWTPST